MIISFGVSDVSFLCSSFVRLLDCQLKRSAPDPRRQHLPKDNPKSPILNTKIDVSASDHPPTHPFLRFDFHFQEHKSSRSVPSIAFLLSCCCSFCIPSPRLPHPIRPIHPSISQRKDLLKDAAAVPNVWTKIKPNLNHHPDNRNPTDGSDGDASPPAAGDGSTAAPGDDSPTHPPADGSSTNTAEDNNNPSSEEKEEGGDAAAADGTSGGGETQNPNPESEGTESIAEEDAEAEARRLLDERHAELAARLEALEEHIRGLQAGLESTQELAVEQAMENERRAAAEEEEKVKQQQEQNDDDDDGEMRQGEGDLRRRYPLTPELVEPMNRALNPENEAVYRAVEADPKSVNH